MRIKFLILILVLFSGVEVAQAGAQLKTSAQLPLDRKVSITKQEYLDTTKLIEEAPLKNTSLAYSVRLPKDWRKLEVQADVQGENVISKGILGNIVEYLGPPTLDLRSSFRIRANDLSYDINAKDWFLGYVLDNNYTLRGIDIVSEKRIEAEYIMLGDNGVQFGVRAVAEISGPRIILAEYVVPLDSWEKEQNMLKWVMSNFRLTNPDPSPIEVMRRYAFVDIAQFDFPSSWVLNPSAITSIERMDASLINLRGSEAARASGTERQVNANILMDGRIDISIVTKRKDVTLLKELGVIKARMADRKLILGDLIEPIKGWPHHQGITSMNIEAYKVNDTSKKLADYEQWVGVLETPGRYYFVTLLTVGRQDDYMIWARNVKAYHTVISTLSPVNK